MAQTIFSEPGIHIDENFGSDSSTAWHDKWNGQHELPSSLRVCDFGLELNFLNKTSIMKFVDGSSSVDGIMRTETACITCWVE